MAIVRRLRRPSPAALVPEVVDPPALTRSASYPAMFDSFGFNGTSYPLGLQTTMGQNDEEPIPADFVGLARNAYLANGPIFSLILTRMMLFSEARFLFQRMRNGRPTEMFSSKALRLLERPWPNGTTGELLARAEQDVSLGGNFYVVRDGNRLRRLRPDRVVIVMGSERLPEDPALAWDADVIGYAYMDDAGKLIDTFLPEQVAHWSPIPDPLAHYRGMSWLTPVIREIQSDKAATDHKARYFVNAGTPNLVVKVPELDYESFKDFKEDFNDEHAGAWNAYKTLFLGGGADVSTVGGNLEQMDFKVVQGAGETRLAAAARVPPIVAGFSEGLASGTYSNYGQARRSFADGFARPQWRTFAAAISALIVVPSDARLWYDDRDIPFLREDLSEESKIRQTDATTVRTLVDAGFEPDAAVNFVSTSNTDALKGNHTGLFSVQLQPPTTGEDPDDTDPPE